MRKATWFGFLALGLGFASAARAGEVLPWGDQGDGTYRNPILPADYSDPDVIRVGDDFYLVASEFHFMGIQVLHSRDLVNWRVMGRVFDRLDVDAKYDEMRAYSQGTWAPSLRYHDGEFFLYVCTPRDGLFLWKTRDPAGSWSERITVKVIDQWEDPCPFWDDDGQAWLVRSRLGAGPIYLHRLSVDGTRLLDDGVEIYRGPVAEGPKLFKRDGWYYISLPEGGVERGGQSVLRAREIHGPYERRVVLPDGSPHQGGLVELGNGESWFVGFKSAGHLGRIMCLQPVKWIDGWPVFGDEGRPIEGGRKPSVASSVPIEHPQIGDTFDSGRLEPQWQWNHNPVPEAWSLTERPGWLRLRGLPAAEPMLARNTLTQKLWGHSGSATVKIDGRGLSEGQRAGLAYVSGKVFRMAGLVRTDGELRVTCDGVEAGPTVDGGVLWVRGDYVGDRACLGYSTDGSHFVDTGAEVALTFSQWKGARLALMSFGAGGGWADFDDFVFKHGTDAVPLELPHARPIDREALVTRHNVRLDAIDYEAPLTVGNGGFAFTVDITGLQTFDEAYCANGIPLETFGRWCRVNDANTRLQSLGRIALEWDKHEGSIITPTDVEAPEQTLDLWRGVITSRYRLGGVPVTVITSCDPDRDMVAVRVESALVAEGRLRVRVAFPRGHDVSTKNTPTLDWTQPDEHRSDLINGHTVQRTVGDTRYVFTCSRVIQPADEPHVFRIVGAPDGGGTLAFTAGFPSAPMDVSAMPTEADVRERSAAHWTRFWQGGAAVDFSGSTNPLAKRIEERIILSRYLTAVQCAGDVPPQEGGLTCNVSCGRHDTGMLWWQTAHFILWQQTALAETRLAWFCEHPGENPCVARSRPDVIYLCDLVLRQSPSMENLERYGALVAETAERLASMLTFDPVRGQYELAVPIRTACENHDPATNRHPAFAFAYLRHALEIAQRWRVRAGLPREAHWDEIIAHLPPLPQKDGRYVPLEVNPDNGDTAAGHVQLETFMALGFLPAGPMVDRETMERTLDTVLSLRDWDAKNRGWEYPMIAMTATRLGRPEQALEILMCDRPNNRCTRAGHCPQESCETAVCLPANGAFLAAVALMVAGWDGCAVPAPGFPKDGSWMVRSEGLQRMP